MYIYIYVCIYMCVCICICICICTCIYIYISSSDPHQASFYFASFLAFYLKYVLTFFLACVRVHAEKDRRGGVAPLLKSRDPHHLAEGAKTSLPCKLQKAKESICSYMYTYIHIYIYTYIHIYIYTLLVRDRLSFRSRCIYPKPITYAAFQPRPFRGRRPFERENLWKLSTFQQK